VIDGTVTILLGNGDGTFSATTTGSTFGQRTHSDCRWDFNADGKPDLAVLNQFDDVVTILLGNGDGRLPQPRRTRRRAFSPYALAVADFNGDGTSDLAVTKWGFRNHLQHSHFPVDADRNSHCHRHFGHWHGKPAC